MANCSVSVNRAVFLAGVLAAVATIVGRLVYKRIKRSSIPTRWREVGTVKNLCIYPFKSAKRIEIEQAECTKQGLMEMEKADKSLRFRDRSIVVYHYENHEYRNSRHHPKMILVEIDARGPNSVIISAPDMENLHLTLPAKMTHKEVVIKHWKNEEISSIDCGDEAAAWISRYILGKESGLRVAYHDGSYKRTQIEKLYKDKIDYYQRGLRNESTGLNSDLTAVHIINQASIRDINHRMGHENVTANHFRPNIVVDGPNLLPFEEDDWVWIKIGDVMMKNVVECMRCSMTTVDLETGVRRTDREPLSTMEKFRISKGPEKAPVMGILLEVFQTGVLSIGDAVCVGQMEKK